MRRLLDHIGRLGRWGLEGRILAAVAVPVALGTVVSAASLVYLHERSWPRQLRSKVAADLRAAQELYDGRLEGLGRLVRLAAGLAPLRKALVSGDRVALEAVLREIRERYGVDILSAADRDGVVLARGRGAPDTDALEVPRLTTIRRALAGEPSAATEVFAAEDLLHEGEELASRARIALVPSSGAQTAGAPELSSGLALCAAAPVLDEKGRLAGVVYGAELLNRDERLVDRMSAAAFGGAVFGGRPAEVATLFLGETRVAASAVLAGQARALGTRVPARMAERILREGERGGAPLFIAHDGYLSACAPLRDGRGDGVGILHVGVLEEAYRALAGAGRATALLLCLAGGLGALALGAVLARWAGRPVGFLAAGVRRAAAGDPHPQIPGGFVGALGELADGLGSLVGLLGQRQAALGALARDAGEGVARRTAEEERRVQELLAARAELLDLLENRRRAHDELAAAYEELRKSRRELGDAQRRAACGALAAAVVHELNNPLAVIQGNLEILSLRAAQDPELAGEVGLISDQLHRLGRLAANLLAVAQGDEGPGELLDVGVLLREALAQMHHRAKAAGVRVEAFFGDALPAVRADPARLRLAFDNLAARALQAMPRGGTLRVEASAAEGAVRISFEDTGPGAAAAARQGAEEAVLGCRDWGRGLGIGVAHALLRERGGSLRLEARPGQGSTFTAVVPGAG